MCVCGTDTNTTYLRLRWKMHSEIEIATGFNVGKAASGTRGVQHLLWFQLCLRLGQSFPEMYVFTEQCVIVGMRTKSVRWDGSMQTCPGTFHVLSRTGQNFTSVRRGRNNKTKFGYQHFWATSLTPTGCVYYSINWLVSIRLRSLSL